MPSWSGVGKASPVSTTTSRPSYSRTVMFLPISPRPPRGRTRSVLLKSDLAQQTLALEHRADGRGLVLVALDQWKAAAADGDAEQVHAGLDRHRQRRDRERVENVHDLLLKRRPIGGLVDHPAHL